MGILVYVLGRSGTGKSYSMRNFKKGELGVINVQGKILPFKGSGAFDVVNTDDSNNIVKNIKSMATKHKAVVVDDFQYVMANEFMRRATERGYDKFTEIARHAWDIADCVRTLPNDVIVYVLCHTDTDQDGFEKLKTIGKLLDEKIVLEGMSTIVLKTAVSDGQYMFLTQNNGKDTVKSPAGMFPSYAIDNDLKYVDEKIRNYYEIGEFLSDEDIKEIDEAVKHEDIPIKDEKKKRGTRRGKEEKEEPSEALTQEEKAESPGDEPGEKPKRKRRVTTKEDTEAAMSEARGDYLEKVNELNADKGEEVDYNDLETPEAKAPERKRRRKATATESVEDEVAAENAAENAADNGEEPEPPKRKRRTKEDAEEPAKEEAPAEETEKPKRRRRTRA